MARFSLDELSDVFDQLKEEIRLKEDLFEGDSVVIKGLSEDSPWEGLEGVVDWVDPEMDDEFQTITVRVNFPTEDGTKEVLQNFDRRNVFKKEAE